MKTFLATQSLIFASLLPSALHAADTEQPAERTNVVSIVLPKSEQSAKNSFKPKVATDPVRIIVNSGTNMNFGPSGCKRN